MKKIVFLGGLSFDSVIQVGEHKYAKLFNKYGYDVFYLSDFLHPYSFLRKSNRDKELIAFWKRGIRKSEEGIYYYTPFCYLPYLKFFGFDSLVFANNCLRYCYPSLREILEKKDFIDVDILFINNIKLISILKIMHPKKVILRISDRIENFINIPSTFGLLKKSIVKTSDAIFVTSRGLEVEAKEYNNNVYYLPNGTDKDFILNDNEEYHYPKEYINIKSPIVLYVGAISRHFDYELFESGLEKLKNVSFVVIGPCLGNNLKRIERFSIKYSNFHYLGSKKHQELKQYLYYSSLGLIPFKINSVTNDINPVKFFEYAGFGLPVLSSYLTEMRNYEGHVFFYKNENEYVELIKSLIDKKEAKQKKIKFALNNTWEKRFSEMIYKIENELI